MPGNKGTAITRQRAGPPPLGLCSLFINSRSCCPTGTPSKGAQPDSRGRTGTVRARPGTQVLTQGRAHSRPCLSAALQCTGGSTRAPERLGSLHRATHTTQERQNQGSSSPGVILFPLPNSHQGAMNKPLPGQGTPPPRTPEKGSSPLFTCWGDLGATATWKDGENEARQPHMYAHTHTYTPHTHTHTHIPHTHSTYNMGLGMRCTGTSEPQTSLLGSEEHLKGLWRRTAERGLLCLG